VDAQAVVVTAGAWAKSLLSSANITLDVWPTRETVGFFDIDVAPPTVVEWGHPALYALPSGDRTIKAAEHIAGAACDPDEEGTINAASLERVRDWVGTRFPGASTSPRFAETCLYTNTSDERFVLERHDRIVVGSPCSGHGFKFAPWVGERLADLAEETLG
jgi:sarcosine oxidase